MAITNDPWSTGSPAVKTSETPPRKNFFGMKKDSRNNTPTTKTQDVAKRTSPLDDDSKSRSTDSSGDSNTTPKVKIKKVDPDGWAERDSRVKGVADLANNFETQKKCNEIFLASIAAGKTLNGDEFMAYIANLKRLLNTIGFLNSSIDGPRFQVTLESRKSTAYNLFVGEAVESHKQISDLKNQVNDFLNQFLLLDTEKVFALQENIEVLKCLKIHTKEIEKIPKDKEEIDYSPSEYKAVMLVFLEYHRKLLYVIQQLKTFTLDSDLSFYKKNKPVQTLFEKLKKFVKQSNISDSADFFRKVGIAIDLEYYEKSLKQKQVAIAEASFIAARETYKDNRKDNSPYMRYDDLMAALWKGFRSAHQANAKGDWFRLLPQLKIYAGKVFFGPEPLSCATDEERNTNMPKIVIGALTAASIQYFKSETYLKHFTECAAKVIALEKKSEKTTDDPSDLETHSQIFDYMNQMLADKQKKQAFFARIDHELSEVTDDQGNNLYKEGIEKGELKAEDAAQDVAYFYRAICQDPLNAAILNIRETDRIHLQNDNDPKDMIFSPFTRGSTEEQREISVSFFQEYVEFQLLNVMNLGTCTMADVQTSTTYRVARKGYPDAKEPVTVTFDIREKPNLLQDEKDKVEYYSARLSFLLRSLKYPYLISRQYK